MILLTLMLGCGDKDQDSAQEKVEEIQQEDTAADTADSAE